MSLEEGFLDALDEDEEEGEALIGLSWRERQRQRLQRKNQSAIKKFLGEGRRINAVGILPRYYGDLLTWALHRYLERERWKIDSTLGYRGPEPVYTNVSTDYDRCENLLIDGQLLIEKKDSRFIVTVDVNPRWRGSVQVEGPANKKEEIASLVAGVTTIAEKENFYRGKKIEFAGRIRFLNVQEKSWDSIVLDTETKAEIKANTIGFLRRGEQWSRYGIPLKRGILLAGEPGTGKTLICKALMAEASGITCITTNAYAMDIDDYITELYELAQSLSPCMVFIEDIDLIGQKREEFGYRSGASLISLLSVLDGIEEHRAIITIATTNCLESLDKALSQRPSRFDRVIRLTCPSLDERQVLISRLSQKIPLSEATQDYLALRTDGCSPSQIQEIIYGLAIEHRGDSPSESDYLRASKEEIERAILKINARHKPHLGFICSDNGNRTKPKYLEVG